MEGRIKGVIEMKGNKNKEWKKKERRKITRKKEG